MPFQSRRLRRELSDDTDRQDQLETLIYIDDRALMRECVAGQLAEWLPEFSVAALASYHEIEEPSHSGRDRSMLFNTHALRIDDVEFLRLLPAMQREGPPLHVAVLSDLDSRANVIAALRHGVSGYLLTSLPLKIAAEVIRLVHAGGTFIPPSVVLGPDLPAPVDGDTRNGAQDMRGFTPRQVDVLRRLREGKQNKAIAFELNMSESTVKVHLHHIMQKLQATNRMQVILRTRQMFEPCGPDPGQDLTNGTSGLSTEAVAALWPINLAARAGDATA